MKKIVTALLCIVCSTAAVAQTSISIDSVNNYIGRNVIVCNEVYGVKTTDKVTYINLGAAYPNSPLTVIIFTKDLTNFPESPEKMYGNQHVCVTGALKEYKGKVEIIISKPEDLKVQ
jgi:DNA/RNA endonuclease YhcR with UshA esterase domain